MVIKSVKQTEQGVFIGFNTNLNVTDLNFKVEIVNKKFYFRPIEIEVISYDTVSVIAKEMSSIGLQTSLSYHKIDLKDLLSTTLQVADESDFVKIKVSKETMVDFVNYKAIKK